MTQAGLAETPRRSRRAEIWSDELSWEPERRGRLVPVAGDAAPQSRAASSSGGVPGRRTVTITGRGAERSRPPVTGAAPAAATRPNTARARAGSVRPHERPGFRPDRVAMWAVLLGLVLVLIAATSSHAAVLSHALAH